MSRLNQDKRKRDPVFTRFEKAMLIGLCEEHYGIIENKKTDAVSSKIKCNEWEIIASKFNASSLNVEREKKSLKNCWENLKKKAKTVLAASNENKFATGGGPSKDFEVDPNMEKVISLIQGQVEGFAKQFDSDAIQTPVLGDFKYTFNSDPTQLPPPTTEKNGSPSLQNDLLQKEFNNPILKEVNEGEESEHNDQMPMNGAWSRYTPAMLRAPRASVHIENANNQTDENVSVTDNDDDLSITEERQPVKKHKTNLRKTTRHAISRRRPILKESEAAALTKTRIISLKTTTEQAKQQHEVTMRIMLLQEQQEEEKLRQEKLKTEILKEELRRKLEN